MGTRNHQDKIGEVYIDNDSKLAVMHLRFIGVGEQEEFDLKNGIIVLILRRFEQDSNNTKSISLFFAPIYPNLT